jgi:hypothetical protein
MSNELEQPDRLDHPKQLAFLAAYINCTGHKGNACREAGVGRRTFYDWLDKDPEFKRAFELTHEEFCDALEAEAYRRAIDGWEEPVFQNGKMVGKKKKHSDTMLAMLLNGNMPEKYQRQKIEHSGPGGGPMQVDHRLEQLRETLDDARGDVNYARLERERAIEHSRVPGTNGHGGKSGPMANGSAPRIS